ncbi:hypothetical protein HOLleu_03218 [Holothuria leucospilota]|uniref:Uncharacterized protein n=1 Tax=Holothuria leucospilota TaxID=206669 RepID=A0A9Q1CRB6_HOLLE|nr:hypothetical protein HOLleu_03218 [Holothuria leucospilota]
MQQPAITIPENMDVFDTVYELTGSVLMEPRHFFNVVRSGDAFLLINGTPPINEAHNYPLKFSTFSGAVRNAIDDSSRDYFTSPLNKGIHVLLYHKMTSLHVPVGISNEKLKTFETNIRINASVDVNELSPCRSENGACLSDTPSHVTKPCTSTPHSNRGPESNDVSHEADDIGTYVSHIHGSSFSESESLENPCRKELFPQKESSSQSKSAANVSVDPNYSNQSKIKENEMGEIDNKKLNNERIIKLNGVDVTVTSVGNNLFLSCTEVFQAMGLLKHIRKDGYVRCIDKHLINLDLI